MRQSLLTSLFLSIFGGESKAHALQPAYTEISQEANSIPVPLRLSPEVVITGGPFMEMTKKEATGPKSRLELCLPR